ncbi:peptidoglycan-binding protein [Pseudobutyrivibrio sp.]
MSKAVQAAKLLSGYSELDEATSEFSQAFEEYIKSWQRKHNLTPDGIIGTRSWDAICKEAPVCSTSKNKKSVATQAIQLLLNGADLEADGIYGSKTKKAVAAYQTAVGLDADGICGKLTWEALIIGVSQPGKVTGKYIKPVDYKQGDSRWGKKMYSSVGNKNQTFANSACGPTAMADLLATLVDKSITPETTAALALKWGDRTASSGTATSFFPHIQKEYGFKKMVGTGSLTTLKACLDAGGYVVCRMGKGYWTKGGHYICAWKYDSKYIYCNDPASSTRKSQNQSDFLAQRKDFWCFFPEREGKS